jgi:predicted transposase YbfD/YdcC
MRIKRTRIIQGERSVEYTYAITSLRADQADARDLLAFQRGHWRIENQLHWVRDVAMGEDKCRARTGFIPQNLAALRNAAITLLRTSGHKAITATLRLFATSPAQVLAKLNL